MSKNNKTNTKTNPKVSARTTKTNIQSQRSNK